MRKKKTILEKECYDVKVFVGKLWNIKITIKMREEKLGFSNDEANSFWGHNGISSFHISRLWNVILLVQKKWKKGKKKRKMKAGGAIFEDLPWITAPEEKEKITFTAIEVVLPFLFLIYHIVIIVQIFKSFCFCFCLFVLLLSK